MGRLRDKVILVTGAAGGIGSAVVDAVVENGAIGIATDLEGKGAIDHVLDVTAEADWHRVLASVERTAGRLDGLVNAAGVVTLGSVEEIDFAHWRRVLSVNLDGVFLGCKFALGLMRRTGGSIVNLSSVSGLVGGHNLAAYNASKGGVRLLSKSVALHGARLAPQVRCNSVHPAFIEGDMTEGMVLSTSDPERARARMMRDIPIGRFGKTTEVADLCVYLLSDESAFVTGAEFVIDGGLTAR